MEQIESTSAEVKDKITETAQSSEAPSSTANGATTSTTDSTTQPSLAVNTSLEATKKETDPAKTPGTPDWARAPKRTNTEKVVQEEPTISSTANGNTTNGAQKDRGRDTERPRPDPQERDVSPGTRADGSHATTSGDKGQSYQPPTGLGKLKGKLFGGK